MRSNQKLTIIGAGPVGLACAFYAKKEGLDFEVFEASDSYGGNCRTFEIDGFRFDSGAHRLHDKIEDVTEDWKSILGDSMLSIEKPSKIVDHQRTFDFPLSPLNLLKNLSFKELVTAAIQFLFYRQKNDSFSERARFNYTPLLADKFLLNYSKKLWGIDPNELLPEVSGGRLNGLSLLTMLKELFNNDTKKTEHLDGRFFYPEYGIQQVLDKIIEEVGDKITYNSPLEKVTIEGCQITDITTGGNKYEVSHVINSAPIHLLLDTEKPDFRHLILMTINLNRSPIGEVATYYFPSNSYKFTRVVEPCVRSKTIAPEGKTSLMIEIPVDSFDEVDTEDLKNEILEQLEKAQFFKKEEVLQTNFFNLPNAYPVLSRSNKERVNQTMDHIKDIKNLDTYGRSGGFSYVHLHDIFKFAKNSIADYIENH